MARVFNFSAGPSALPLAVLQQVRDDLTDWQGGGMSVMEMSHRSAGFSEIAQQAEADLRELLAIPDNYKVLFLQGGATLQFAAVPLNLSAPGQRLDYVITGSWGKKAHKEGGRYGAAVAVADAAGTNYTSIPDESAWAVAADAAFLHYTPNETIGGVEFHNIPDSGGVPLVADMSSTILSRPVDISRFGVIYAGAQKNIGPAGLTVVIVRDDLIGHARPETPAMLNYQVHADSGSMSNTPATFSWYVAGLVFKWLRSLGGLPAIAEINRRKKDKLYGFIDASGFYANPVDPDCRSWMNIPFTLADPALDPVFLKTATAAGLANLKGHRSVGGMRASIYNAMPEEGVDALIDVMRDFEKKHG
ncbi:MAG: 3-phosphoserine/phosphohydroxythreonine transaminase [Gammaproteobacteria bacterium]|nr:3-phosphoserine/phosphohydroxythreonine transaminase [Gammaproteobacteria bacterium]NNF61916.1 3-phosphoserine/phosphohydroxythreonine transaminase [Gammaproteobacteria bacterium]NNM19780.1 3-phosphoserine/phosphohydroxythreonine transaminase [Gammaproteobacteria bacterium]